MYPPPHITHVSSSSYDTQECLFVLASPLRHPLSSLEVCGKEDGEEDRAVVVADWRGGLSFIPVSSALTPS
jgi:hypothetical protein